MFRDAPAYFQSALSKNRFSRYLERAGFSVRRYAWDCTWLAGLSPGCSLAAVSGCALTFQEEKPTAADIRVEYPSRSDGIHARLARA